MVNNSFEEDQHGQISARELIRGYIDKGLATNVFNKNGEPVGTDLSHLSEEEQLLVAGKILQSETFKRKHLEIGPNKYPNPDPPDEVSFKIDVNYGKRVFPDKQIQMDAQAGENMYFFGLSAEQLVPVAEGQFDSGLAVAPYPAMKGTGVENHNIGGVSQNMAKMLKAGSPGAVFINDDVWSVDHQFSVARMALNEMGQVHTGKFTEVKKAVPNIRQEIPKSYHLSENPPVVAFVKS